MSISEDLARTGLATVFAQMFTDFPPGFSKLVSEQNRGSSTVHPTPGTMLLRGRDETTHILTQRFNLLTRVSFLTPYHNTLYWCPIS